MAPLAAPCEGLFHLQLFILRDSITRELSEVVQQASLFKSLAALTLTALKGSIVVVFSL